MERHLLDKHLWLIVTRVVFNYKAFNASDNITFRLMNCECTVLEAMR